MSDAIDNRLKIPRIIDPPSMKLLAHQVPDASENFRLVSSPR
jgi:hypothetical protein